MSYAQSNTYEKCDILINNNDLKFDNNLTLGQVIDIAIQNRSPIIVKNGVHGMWYLKGKGISYDVLKAKLDAAVPRHRVGVYTMLLKLNSV